MKILWVNTNFMHPTTKGGQIRTLEMLRHIHRRHEVHYVAIEDPSHPEGPGRCGEYATRAYPMQHRIPDKRHPVFYWELTKGLFDPVPVAVSRFHPPGAAKFIEDLIVKERFDCAVVDHLAPTAYFPRLSEAVFFQHNVETMIWRRRLEHAGGLSRYYLELQERRMFEYEKRVSLEAGHIVAVSAVDAQQMRELFGASRISEVPTGVNLEYFTPPPEARSIASDLVFIGSMDWLPNVDGMLFFVNEVLPHIRRRRPQCRVAIVGRKPPPEILALAAGDPMITVTGTVPDIRPYLWGAKASIVPLRIGGGTRLKIYESMGARVPVVSTAIGAEGLDIHPPADIRIADEPLDFAEQCLDLMEDEAARRNVAEAAWTLVSEHFSWDRVAGVFEEILRQGPRLR